MPNYTLKRDYYNTLSAETLVSLGQADSPVSGERFLSVSTSKASRGGIWTLASCFIQTPNSRVSTIPDDFFKTVQKVPCSRVTEKALITAHESALSGLDDIQAKVKAFYEGQSAA